jgi:hypothetical protein
LRAREREIEAERERDGERERERSIPNTVAQKLPCYSDPNIVILGK